MEEPEKQAPTQALLPGRRSILVRLVCKSGLRPALLDVLNAYADNLSEEPGTEMFVVSLDPENDTTIWLYEIFRDEAAENAHRESDGFAALMRAERPLLDGPPAVLRMDPLRISMQEAVLVEDWSFKKACAS